MKKAGTNLLHFSPALSRSPNLTFGDQLADSSRGPPKGKVGNGDEDTKE